MGSRQMCLKGFERTDLTLVQLISENNTQSHDPVNRPTHYTSHPSGVECIQIVEEFNFCVGNAIKYLWRAGLKGDALEDLEKARWYVDREIAKLRNQQHGNNRQDPSSG